MSDGPRRDKKQYSTCLCMATQSAAPQGATSASLQVPLERDGARDKKGADMVVGVSSSS